MLSQKLVVDSYRLFFFRHDELPKHPTIIAFEPATYRPTLHRPTSIHYSYYSLTKLYLYKIGLCDCLKIK